MLVSCSLSLSLPFCVAFWDLRKGSSPVESSMLESSHHDPVYDVFWIQSRTGNECCSISTDGQLLWWDIRKLKKGPTDAMTMQGENDVVFGGTAMEYKSDAGVSDELTHKDTVSCIIFSINQHHVDSQELHPCTGRFHNGVSHLVSFLIDCLPFPSSSCDS